MTKKIEFEGISCCICNKCIPSGTLIDVDCFELWNGQFACSREHAENAEVLLNNDRLKNTD